MGLGKTITCVSLIASTLSTAREFSQLPLPTLKPPTPLPDDPDPAHFEGAVWGMPTATNNMSAKKKAQAQKLQEKLECDYVRASRIKTRSRATLIICPLSTVANWEDQFREHWKGEVHVVGGSGQCLPVASATSSQPATLLSMGNGDLKAEIKSARIREGASIRVYVYHGNARRPDPTFLADFDAVITTYATLATEYSKQTRSIAANQEAEDEDEASSDGGACVEVDEHGNQIIRLSKPKKSGLKRKHSSCAMNGPAEHTSALQSVHWFRVVLDEAQ
jgi:SWI/SNF-related matrix-associated actin-dependent regulator of chromatin subfamily A3